MNRKCEIVDEISHLTFLDDAVVVIINFLEDPLELLVADLVVQALAIKVVLDQLPRLLLVQGARFVLIVPVPELVH